MVKNNKESNLTQSTGKLDKVYLSKAKDSQEILWEHIEDIEFNLNSLDIDENCSNLSGESSQAIEGLKEKFEYTRDLLNHIALKSKVKKQEYDVLKNEKKKIEKLLEKLKKDKKDLEQEFLHVRKEVDRNDVQIASGTETLKELLNDIEKSEKDLFTLKDSIKLKKSEENTLASAIVQKKQKLDHEKQNLELVKAKLEKVNGKLSKKMEKNEKLQTIIHEKKKSVDKLKRKKDIIENKIKNFNQSFEEKKIELNHVEEQIETTQAALRKLRQEKINFESLFEKYKTQLDKQIQDTAESEKILSDFDEKVEEKKEELNSLKDLINNKEKRMGEINKISEKVQEDLDSRKEKLDALETQINEKETDYIQLKEISKNIEEKITQSKQHFGSLKDNLVEQEKEIKKKEEKVHRLETIGFFYKLSKVIGGIILGTSLVFLLITFAVYSDFISPADFNQNIFLPVLLTSSLLLLLSSFLNLVKQ